MDSAVIFTASVGYFDRADEVSMDWLSQRLYSTSLARQSMFGMP